MASCRSRKTGNCLDWSKKKRLPQKVSETSRGIFLFPDRLPYAPGGELRGLAAAPAPVTSGTRLRPGESGETTSGAVDRVPGKANNVKQGSSRGFRHQELAETVTQGPLLRPYSLRLASMGARQGTER